MSNISPGVYTKIIDLSTYVSAVPATTGFICALTKKGRDNEVIFVSSRNELISEWGEPCITEFGKEYGQGLYNAYNFLGESGSLWFMRVLPDNAAYANIRLDANWDGIDTTATISLTYVDDLNSMEEIESQLAQSGNIYPILIFYPIGRGDYYNSISIRLTRHVNPMFEGVYVLDIYEKQEDGIPVIVESFVVSLNIAKIDRSGDSIFIGDILEKYSNILRSHHLLPDGATSPGYDLVVKNYDNNMGVVSADLTAGTASITDTGQDFKDWNNPSESGNAIYSITMIDERGNRLYGWLGASSGVDNETINVFNDRDLDTASQEWISDEWDTDGDGTIDVRSIDLFSLEKSPEYIIKKDLSLVTDAFLAEIPPVLRKGSDGSVYDINHKVNPAECEHLLVKGYAGTIDPQIQDRERIFFTMVFDCGYPTAVKTAIVSLVDLRRDCVAMLDNGDNPNYKISIAKRNSDHIYNTYLAAIYEGYNKIYDSFTGADIWVSPLFHLSYLAPRNDNVAEIWYAIAGFQRGAINSIEELRFNPTIGQRDQMYLRQLNPIVKFNIGYSVWGQLTTQAKPSAMQDLNIVRLVLYCKEALERYCRFYIFEQNDTATWSLVSGDINEFLEEVAGKRGLYSYTVDVGATDYERKSKRFHVNVTLEPTRVVEKIELNFYIK